MYLNHNKNYHDNVTCSFCGKELQSRQLSYHIRAVHKKDESYQCEHCDKVYTMEKYLKDHVKVKHSNSEKPEKCKFCSYSCYYPSRLRQHVRRNHDVKKKRIRRTKEQLRLSKIGKQESSSKTEIFEDENDMVVEYLEEESSQIDDLDEYGIEVTEDN